MKIPALKKLLINEGLDLYFKYLGVDGGVYSEVENSVFHFALWYGKEVKETDDIDVVLLYPFYNGKSLLELSSEIVIDFA